MNQVQKWVAHQLQTLHLCTGQQVQECSWSDDRLALVLDALAQPEQWQRFETALNQRIIQVYQLHPQRVRLDSTTASGYWSVNEEGLFQLGESHDHRPDLPQLKVKLSALDPLGLPLVAGKAADDPVYIAAIKQVSQSLPEHGVLYVGDCKMAALSTRAYVQAQDEVIAQGFEQTVVCSGKVVTGSERQVIVRSIKLAEAVTATLHTHLSKAQADLMQLNEHKQGKKVDCDADALQHATWAICKHRQVEGLLRLRIEEQANGRAVRA